MTGIYIYTPYIWPMLISAFLLIALAVYAWRHRSVPGAVPFAVQNLGVALWAIFTAVEIAATTLSTKILFHKLEGASGILSVTAMAYFALELTSPGKKANRRTISLISLGIFVLLILMVTNDLHHLIWTGFWFDEFLRVGRGPLNLLLIAYVLFIPFLAVFLFLRLSLKSHGIYRQQAILLAIGSSLPVLTLFLEFAGVNPFAPLDPVILMWTVSCLLYGLAIFRYRMLELVPIGRDTAIERMANGLVVLDAENQIVDFNPAAGEILALSRHAAIGRPAGQALAPYPEILKILENKSTESAEFTVSRSNESRTFQAESSPLTHPGGFHLGQLILLEDVTDQRLAQAQLYEHLWAQATLQEREQLADELHDGLSQNLAFLNLQAQAAQIYLQSGQDESARSSLGRLTEASEQIQGETRLMIDNLLSISLPAENFCTTLRRILAGFEGQTGLPVHLDLNGSEAPEENMESCQLPQPVAVQLARISQEALANVRKHAQDASQVHVELKKMDGQVFLIIEDDGSGFDPLASQKDGKHFGLQVMQQRAARIGGHLKISSAPERGTRIEVFVPLVTNGTGSS